MAVAIGVLVGTGVGLAVGVAEGTTAGGVDVGGLAIVDIGVTGGSLGVPMTVAAVVEVGAVTGVAVRAGSVGLGVFAGAEVAVGSSVPELHAIMVATTIRVVAANSLR